MKALFFIFAASLAITQARTIKDQDLIKVDVYYETLCPDSMYFITRQYYPAFATLRKYLDVDLIPYGRANETVVNGTKSFTCQHGPDECYGNKVHACVLNMTTIDVSSEFIYCSEVSDVPASDVTLTNCANLTDISWADIQDCVTNGKADELLSINGKKTDSVETPFIPTVILNGEFSQTLEDIVEARGSFKKYICDLLGNPGFECMC
ncbi:hypothetical protein ABEB36_012630 [Hypothenemus hampei]|uniref:Gamma-interferon-inducible lysosomal thiol reductase n=1 Tax=Hypothenemus hampei TaxID=57062 RepID=A0ABD1EBY6_HYPHA